MGQGLQGFGVSDADIRRMRRRTAPLIHPVTAHRQRRTHDRTYWGTGNPGPWMGDVRLGDNLHTNCKTGDGLLSPSRAERIGKRRGPRCQPPCLGDLDESRDAVDLAVERCSAFRDLAVLPARGRSAGHGSTAPRTANGWRTGSAHLPGIRTVPQPGDSATMRVCTRHRRLKRCAACPGLTMTLP